MPWMAGEQDRVRRIYDERASTYDRTVVGERITLGDFRRAFGAALRGRTLEVAIGSGLNLPAYSAEVTAAIGTDLSRGMLLVARTRAAELERPLMLAQMDAQRLAFRD